MTGKLCGRAYLCLAHPSISPFSASWKYFTSCYGVKVLVLRRECFLFRLGILVSSAQVHHVVFSGEFLSCGILEANWLILLCFSICFVFISVWHLPLFLNHPWGDRGNTQLACGLHGCATKREITMSGCTVGALRMNEIFHAFILGTWNLGLLWTNWYWLQMRAEVAGHNWLSERTWQM